ncbi:MAG: type I DNA topoisomerase [Deltaproteobacteria bacterium]|nr:type I DNA topoisomerase [Deltaproteobacteria bacterium]
MSGKHLVIVESPTKAKTISKFLGKDYTVKASNGHVRDLPSNATEIPASFKAHKWSRLGVNIEKDFEPLYVIPKSKKEHVKHLKDEVKKASLIYLATDEDREGESISWHLVETLEPRIPYKRLVFHEITKEAISESLNNAREIDQNLVYAQETRRILDRLYGYELSPLLWKKIARNLSAGRVQSVTIRLLVERERERMKFVSAAYWTIKGKFQKSSLGDAGVFEADLALVDNKRVALGKDFDPQTGKLLDPDKILALTEQQVTELRDEIKSLTPKVSLVEDKSFTAKPLAPFVTSSLQQEANAKLRLPSKRTMNIAQQLYENGFITYMRTDSTILSQQAINAARNLIINEYGKEYLPKEPRLYTTKVKNAQEAHEAIRPAGEQFTPIDEVVTKLGIEAGKLYELIWKRTIASQMENAKGNYSSALISWGRATFRATGKTIQFPGYLRAYVEGSDDPEAELQDQEKLLPPLVKGENVTNLLSDLVKKDTQPPLRYTEGSLIKELEKRGIGRPSTWAQVVDLVLTRQYAFKRGTSIIPSFVAFAVVNLLEKHFAKLVDYEFTALLEDDLDAISRGEAKTLDYLKSFYYGQGSKGLKDLIASGEKGIDPREICSVPIGHLDGKLIEVRIGRYGPYLTDGSKNASIPDNFAPDELIMEKAISLLSSPTGSGSLGTDPKTEQPVYLKKGPYGHYVQLGDAAEKKRPKMVALLKNMEPENIDLETALRLLQLPRVLGVYPGSKDPILVNTGRFGPYVQHNKDFRSINLNDYSPLDITLDQALELLARPKRARGRAEPETLKELGIHPASNATIFIKVGRYGPYLTDGTVNVALGKKNPDEITLDHAINLIHGKAESAPVKKTRRSNPRPAPKSKK